MKIDIPTKPSKVASAERKIQKLFNIDIKSVDETKRQVTFCFSDDQPDRQGEVVDQKSWDTRNYQNNPIILWGHDSYNNENALGTATALDLDQNGSGRSYVTAQFDTADTNPNADTVFKQILSRTLRCVSASFINHTFEIEDDQVVLKDNELLEISVVSIPANPRAIALSYTDGSLSTKDARWMRDSMRKEADALDVMLAKNKDATNSQLGGDQKAMEELQTQISTLLDGVTKLTEKLDAVEQQNTDLKAEVAALKPAEPTDEEKSAKEAADKQAADEAAAKAEADAKAAQDAKDAADKEAADKAAAEAAANGEVDGEAELTDEVKAQIDAQLATATTDTSATTE